MSNLEPVHCFISSSNLLLDLHTGFSADWSGGLVFPSLALTGKSGCLFWGHCSFLLGPVAHKVLLVPSECLWKVWGFIPKVIFALLLSCWGFSFNLRRRVSFFGGIHHSSVGGCSAVNCSFGVLAGANEHTPFYSAILAPFFSCFNSNEDTIQFETFSLLQLEPLMLTHLGRLFITISMRFAGTSSWVSSNRAVILSLLAT